MKRGLGRTLRPLPSLDVGQPEDLDQTELNSWLMWIIRSFKLCKNDALRDISLITNRMKQNRNIRPNPTDRSV